MQAETPEAPHCLDETKPVTRLDDMRKETWKGLFFAGASSPAYLTSPSEEVLRWISSS